MTSRIKYHWTTGSGRLDLQLTQSDVDSGSHPGPCDSDVDYLTDLPRIRKQTDAWDPADLARELGEYGAWDDAELSDHSANVRRMVWIACNDCSDDPDYHRA